MLLALVVVTVLAAEGMLGALQGGVLIMFPAVLLAVVMVTRPYIGEDVIAALRARRVGRDTAKQESTPRSPATTHLARGGRLIAVALAGRAPPIAFVA